MSTCNQDTICRRIMGEVKVIVGNLGKLKVAVKRESKQT